MMVFVLFGVIAKVWHKDGWFGGQVYCHEHVSGVCQGSEGRVHRVCRNGEMCVCVLLRLLITLYNYIGCQDYGPTSEILFP